MPKNKLGYELSMTSENQSFLFFKCSSHQICDSAWQCIEVFPVRIHCKAPV